MKYRRHVKRATIEYTEEVHESLSDDDVTEVLINIDLKQHKRGFSLDLLKTLIETVTEGFTSYRIFHNPDGLTITGRYE